MATKLKATQRNTQGRKNDTLRQEGIVPAVVYGVGVDENKHIAVDRNDFVRAFKKARESTIVELGIEGDETINVLIQDFQLDPLRDEVIHADFRAVDMTQPVEAEVGLEFVGTAPAVKAQGGTLVRSIKAVQIRALPKDLVVSIEVPIDSLETFEDVIHIEDLDVPEGVEILDSPERAIAVVTPPRTEEELEALESAVEEDVSAVEVISEEEEALLEGEEGELEEGEEETPEEAADEEGEEAPANE